MCLQTGQSIRYDISGFETGERILKFWLKPELVPVPLPTAVVWLTGKDDLSEIQLFLNDKKIQLLFRADPTSKPLLLESEKDLLSEGRWVFLAVHWKNAGGEEVPVRLFCNGKKVPMESLSSNEVEGWQKDASPKMLQIGLWSSENATEQFGVRIRDLALLQGGSADLVQKTVQAEKENADHLIFRAVDLYHFNGKRIEDSEASEGIAWTTDVQMAMIDGLSVPTGEYELAWRIKPKRRITPGEILTEVWAKSSKGERVAFDSRRNTSADFRRLDSYQDFALRFRVEPNSTIGFELDSFVPFMHALALDTVTVHSLSGSWQYQKRGEELQHTMGVWHEDPDAANGRAWQNHVALTFGPYACIGQPGRYRATWRIKIDKGVGDNVPLLRLDVYAHDGFFPEGRRGSKIYSELHLTSDDFARRKDWETKSIEFRYDGADRLEFRTFAKVLQPRAIRIDTITVERVEQNP